MKGTEYTPPTSLMASSRHSSAIDAPDGSQQFALAAKFIVIVVAIQESTSSRLLPCSNCSSTIFVDKAQRSKQVIERELAYHSNNQHLQAMNRAFCCKSV
jgi:hypothetical protein